MELDKRIMSGKKPLTCFDIDEAEKYVGKKCYISNEYDFFRNLDFTQQKILNGVEDCEEPFHYDQFKRAEFCLPCEWVKEPEKKYRPYTINEFLKKFKLGDSIVIRYKGNDTYQELLFTGYSKDYVHLGASVFGFNSLFESYEFGIHYDEFVPFGVLEE